MYETALEEECPALAFVSALVHKEETHPFVFRNYNLPARWTSFANNNKLKVLF